MCECVCRLNSQKASFLFTVSLRLHLARFFAASKLIVQIKIENHKLTNPTCTEPVFPSIDRRHSYTRPVGCPLLSDKSCDKLSHRVCDRLAPGFLRRTRHSRSQKRAQSRAVDTSNRVALDICLSLSKAYFQ